MAVTFSDLVARVKQQLLGYSRDQASISYLVASMTATATTFQIDPETVTSLSRGLIEIDDELLLIKKYDRSSGIATVMGGAGTAGRGVEGTVAASHPVDTLITNNPQYPRTRVKEAINDTILGVYPDLFVFAEYEFPYNSARFEYPIPADADGVHKVVVNTIGPSGVWFPLTSWRFNAVASTTAGQVKPTPTPTGKSIQLMRDQIVPGRNVRVTYTKPPAALVANTDLFTATGFPDRYVDMIVYGACWRLLPALEAARLQQQAIEATERAPLVPAGAGSSVSKFFYGLYRQRLDEERDRLFQLNENYQTFNS